LANDSGTVYSNTQLEERVARLSTKGAIVKPINCRHREIVGDNRWLHVSYTAFVMTNAVYCHTKSVCNRPKSRSL